MPNQNILKMRIKGFAKIGKTLIYLLIDCFVCVCRSTVVCQNMKGVFSLGHFLVGYMPPPLFLQSLLFFKYLFNRSCKKSLCMCNYRWIYRP